MTQIELRQYGIQVSEPVCQPKNGKRKFGANGIIEVINEKVTEGLDYEDSRGAFRPEGK